MNFVILSSLFHPEPTANAVRMSELAKVLHSAGHRVEVLTGFPYYRNQAPDPEFSGRYIVERQWNGMRLIHCYTYVARSASIIERLKTFNSFALSAVWAGATRLSPGTDAIIAISPPFFTGFSALALSRYLKVPYIFDIQDLYPETAVHLGVIRNRRLIQFLEKLERTLYRKAAGMIGISDGFSAHFKKCGVHHSRVEVLPNWVDTAQFSFQPFRTTAITVENPLTIGFFGNHGLAQGLETIIDGIGRVHDEQRVRFVFMGDGAAKQKILERATAMGLKNIRFDPPAPHELVPEKLAEFDVGIVHLCRNPLYRITVPCKTYEYMALGKPILIGVDGEARKIVETAQAGVFFEPENPESFADSVRGLLSDAESLSPMGSSGRRTAEASYSKEVLGRRYLAFLEHTAQPPGCRGAS